MKPELPESRGLFPPGFVPTETYLQDGAAGFYPKDLKNYSGIEAAGLASWLFKIPPDQVPDMYWADVVLLDSVRRAVEEGRTQNAMWCLGELLPLKQALTDYWLTGPDPQQWPNVRAQMLAISPGFGPSTPETFDLEALGTHMGVYRFAIRVLEDALNKENTHGL